MGLLKKIVLLWGYGLVIFILIYSVLILVIGSALLQVEYG